MKKGGSITKKPFITAVVALILVALLTLSVFLYPSWIEKFSFLLSIFIFGGSILILVGFYSLGKKYNNKFLTRTIIVGFILYTTFTLFVFYTSQDYQERVIVFNETTSLRIANLEQAIMENVSEEVISLLKQEMINEVFKTGLPILLPLLIGYLILAIYYTFFGIGMIKLKKVKYSKAIGVIAILSVWLILTIIGIFLVLPLFVIGYVLAVLLFLEESKKAKE